MDYPDNDYLQKQQPLFDDNTLEKEFSDPKLALDFDGDIAHTEMVFSNRSWGSKLKEQS